MTIERLSTVTIALLLIWVWPAAHADEDAWGFRSRVELQLSGATQNWVEDSLINPGNALGVPDSYYSAELRPDFSLETDRISLDFKPRFRADRLTVEDGEGNRRSDSESDSLVNEWLFRYRFADRFFLSAGRENLQWGPSLLLSPSNPFNPNNNRNNPRSEVPGLDYFRAVLIPDADWSVSVMANVGEGALDVEPEHRDKFAVKIDYTGDRKYFSVIPSLSDGDATQDDSTALGFYASFSPDDAVLLYGEGAVAEDSTESSVLLGGSYTFMNTSVLALEFFKRSEGCVTDSYSACDAAGFDIVPEFAGLGNSLIRERYVLTQFYRDWDRTGTSLVLRWIRGLDDSSDRVVLILEHELGDRLELFAIANVTGGGPDTEFGSLLDSSAQIGISYTF